MSIADIINLGGFGFMAIAMFWLHIRSLDVFRTQLDLQRSECREDHTRLANLLTKKQSRRRRKPPRR